MRSIFNWPLSLYPFFEIVDAARVCLKLKREHARIVPLFALWSATILNCHAGNLLSHILRGKPALEAFNNLQYIALVSIVFTLIVLIPGNRLIEAALRIPLVEIGCIATCEVFRCYKILKGINEGQRSYPGTYWPSIILGSIRGNGSGWMKPVRSIILNDSPFRNEWTEPTLGAKAAMLSAVLLTLCDQDPYIFLAVQGLFISMELKSFHSQWSQRHHYHIKKE